VGELGNVAKTEATSEVGLLFSSETGVIAEITCEGTTFKVEGTIAGEVEFVSEAVEHSNVIFAPSGTTMKIKSIETLTKHEPVIKLNGTTATLESTETYKPTTKGIDIFICLIRSPGNFESLVKCAKSEGFILNGYEDGWKQFLIW
jgi:hypothetical protein